MNQAAIQSERRLPRSLHHRHAVTIQRPRAEVFHFLTHRVAELYADLSPGHEHFRVIGGGPLRLNAEVDCRERADNQLVHHHYRVRTFHPNKHLYLASLPTHTWIHLKHRTIQDQANTHVYYDLSDTQHGTLLDIAIVIQLRSIITKCLAVMTGGSRVWQRHQHEEMARMKSLIEQSQTT